MRWAYLHGRYISYRRAARDNLAALRAAGVACSRDPAQADVVVLHHQPERYRELLAACPAQGERYVVGFAVYDSPTLPRAFIDGLELVDELWTATRFTRDAVRRHAPRCFVLPHGVPAPSDDPQALRAMRERLDSPPDRYLYYSIVNPEDPRKATPLALACFARLREQLGDAVGYVLKCYGGRVRDDWPLDGVTVIEDLLSDAEVSALHRLCHACVSPHRGEGWGYVLSDAMASGRAVIATGYSGNMAYMDQDSAYLVAYDLRGMQPDECRYDAPHRTRDTIWAYAREDDLLRAMRAAYAERADNPRGRRARNVVERFGLGRRAVVAAALAAAAQHRAREKRRRGPAPSPGRSR